MRLIDFCITHLEAQGPSRTCNESKEEAHTPPPRWFQSNLLRDEPLPSEVRTTSNVARTSIWKTRPESGFDCLMCATLGRRRMHDAATGGRSSYLGVPSAPDSDWRAQVVPGDGAGVGEHVPRAAPLLLQEPQVRRPPCAPPPFALNSPSLPSTHALSTSPSTHNS